MGSSLGMSRMATSHWKKCVINSSFTMMLSPLASSAECISLLSDSMAASVRQSPMCIPTSCAIDLIVSSESAEICAIMGPSAASSSAADASSPRRPRMAVVIAATWSLTISPIVAMSTSGKRSRAAVKNSIASNLHSSASSWPLLSASNLCQIASSKCVFSSSAETCLARVIDCTCASAKSSTNEGICALAAALTFSSTALPMLSKILLNNSCELMRTKE
eukprot:Amastigsp_a5553_32.p4 type:complete len:220 gc:universal Amastigsp_a5553_32:2246-2905(+)